MWDLTGPPDAEPMVLGRGPVTTIGAVFEGIKAYWNPDQQELYGLQFAEHYRRFLYSMRFQRMETRWSAGELVNASVELLRANEVREDSYVRPMAYFGDTDWFSTSADSSTDCFICTAPFTSRLGTGRTVRACVSSWTRLADTMMPPRIKCVSNYQNSRLALMEARRHGYDSPILLNDRGKVTEGPASCLFVVRAGAAIRPHQSAAATTLTIQNVRCAGTAKPASNV